MTANYAGGTSISTEWRALLVMSFGLMIYACGLHASVCKVSLYACLEQDGFGSEWKRPGCILRLYVYVIDVKHQLCVWIGWKCDISDP